MKSTYPSGFIECVDLPCGSCAHLSCASDDTVTEFANRRVHLYLNNHIKRYLNKKGFFGLFFFGLEHGFVLLLNVSNRRVDVLV